MLYCIVLYCIVLYCIVLYCVILYSLYLLELPLRAFNHHVPTATECGHVAMHLCCVMHAIGDRLGEL